jgi:hypothetical protein
MTGRTGRGTAEDSMAQEFRNMEPSVGERTSLLAWVSLALGVLIYLFAAVLA